MWDSVSPAKNGRKKTHRPCSAESAESSDLNQAVLARLTSFPPPQQEAVRLKFLQQFSYREIAEVLGSPSEDTARVAVRRALERLRKRLPGIKATDV